MNGYKHLCICLLTVLGVAVPYAWGQCPSPPVITSHQDGDPAFYGAHITLKCTGGTPPLTWSGPGSFNPATGSEVVWTAPASGTTATVTVTDNVSQSDSVTFDLTNIIYVDKDCVSDVHDGTTWAKAFNHLKDGLGVATSGREIWVAAATYKPDEDADHPTGTGSQYVTFTLVSGVAVYGGFAGTETSRSQRNWSANETILSGDVDEDSTLDAQNSQHVVTCTSGGSTTVLDGFTVTMGFADDYYCDGGGIKLNNCSPTIANCLITENKAWEQDGDGGGMHCQGASPTVTNCTFSGNIAGDDGGALCNKAGSSGSFTDCTFSGNSTEGDNGNSHGGAIFNTTGEGGGGGSSPSFTDCTISGNTTVHKGGGVCNSGSGSNPTFSNCLVTGNTAGDEGGGMAWREGSSGSVSSCIVANNGSSNDGGGVSCKAEVGCSCTTSFVNCIFTGNSASDKGGGSNNTDLAAPSYTNCTFYGNSATSGNGLASKDSAGPSVTNCIVWDGASTSIYTSTGGSVSITYSDVAGGYSGTGNISGDPQFTNPGSPAGSDGTYVTSDDGLQITEWSPCVNAASAASAPSTDILGTSRGGQPDMGAYECDMADSDGDGMPNWFEEAYNINSIDGDEDSDDWRNCTEYLLRTNPRDNSSDGMDRMPSLSGPVEIEAKWGLDSSLFSAIYADFPEDGTYAVGGTSYTINRKWSNGSQRLYVDNYYDDSSDTFVDGLQVFRHRRRYSNPANYPNGTPDWHRIQYKSVPTRYGAAWFRDEYGPSQELTLQVINDVLAGDTDIWTKVNPQPYVDGVQGVFVDYPSYSLYDTLDVLVHVEDLRRKTDLEISNTAQFTLSFDHVTEPDEEYELELEVVANSTSETQLEEFFRIIYDFQQEYSGLTPSTTSKGGTYIPDYFD